MLLLLVKHEARNWYRPSKRARIPSSTKEEVEQLSSVTHRCLLRRLCYSSIFRFWHIGMIYLLTIEHRHTPALNSAVSSIL
jgi:hypothetical protein